MFKTRNRDKLVATQVSDFILDITLFPAGLRVHKHWLEAVVLAESLEAFSNLTASAFDDICNDGPGIVKPDFCRNPTDVLKHRRQSFQQALRVFAVVQLEIAAIAMGEAENKVLCFVVEFAVLVEISISEVGLCLAGMMLEGKITFLLLEAELCLLFGHISSRKVV